MPKNRKIQVAASKNPRTKNPPVDVEDEITAPEAVDAETSTSATYEVSEAATASGASSVEEENFVTPLPVPVVPAPRGRTTDSTLAAPTPDPAPRISDAANLLFSPLPDSIHPDVVRGRAALHRRRIEQTHQATLSGLQSESRPISPPRPGTRGDALSTAHLHQIRGYLQDQQVIIEDKTPGFEPPLQRHPHDRQKP